MTSDVLDLLSEIRILLSKMEDTTISGMILKAIYHRSVQS